MLTELLWAMQPRWWHLVMRLLGITEDVHDWLEGFCPCDHAQERSDAA